MDAKQLRSLQLPLKKKFLKDPDAARYTLRAEGRLNPDRISVTIPSGHAQIEAGLHPATGGDGTLACSGDMLLEALAACAGVTLNAVATAMGIHIEEGTVTAEGEIDFRGTLGVDRQAPVGLQAIRLRFDLNCDADDDQMATLLSLTERYCVVHATLAKSCDITIGYQRHGAAVA